MFLLLRLHTFGQHFIFLVGQDKKTYWLIMMQPVWPLLQLCLFKKKNKTKRFPNGPKNSTVEDYNTQAKIS
jgi:hypothetical protein